MLLVEAGEIESPSIQPLITKVYVVLLQTNLPVGHDSMLAYSSWAFLQVSGTNAFLSVIQCSYQVEGPGVTPKSSSHIFTTSPFNIIMVIYSSDTQETSCIGSPGPVNVLIPLNAGFMNNETPVTEHLLGRILNLSVQYTLGRYLECINISYSDNSEIERALVYMQIPRRNRHV